MNFVNIGYGNMAAAHRLIAVVNPDSAPVRRMVQDARDAKTLVDATAGRKMRSVLVMDTGQITLSALQPETIIQRMEEAEEGK